MHLDALPARNSASRRLAAQSHLNRGRPADTLLPDIVSAWCDIVGAALATLPLGGPLTRRVCGIFAQ
jgi:hypothetical protein